MLTPSQESKRPPEVFNAASHSWSDCVIDPVGVDDDFLELGGDSLLAMRVLAKCRDAFGVDLPAISVVESRTLAALPHVSPHFLR